MELLLTEPAIVADIFTSGLADAEDLGDGNFRFTMYAKQKSFCGREAATEYIIVARIIMPATAVLLSIQATMKAMGIACCRGGERMTARH